MPLGSVALTAIAKELWGEKVKVVERGPRSQRSYFYLNLARKNPQQKCNSDPVLQLNLDEVKRITIPDGWTTIIDHDNKVTFIRYENWTYRGQRVTTEFTVTKSDSGEIRYGLPCHGSSIDVQNVVDTAIPKNYSLSEKVKSVLELLERSNLCLGVPVPDNEVVIAIVDYEIGAIQDLSTASNESIPIKTEKRTFSSTCGIFCHDKCCAYCLRLKNFDARRKKRKRGVCVVHPHTNKRYLTKEEVGHQLQEEKRARINAENREKYWRDKFQTESLLLDEEDHQDLSSMLSTIPSENVPESMTCLWEQQLKLMQTKKNGYRWHPK